MTETLLNLIDEASDEAKDAGRFLALCRRLTQSGRPPNVLAAQILETVYHHWAANVDPESCQ